MTAAAEQLALFEPTSSQRAYSDQDAEYLRLGILRHGRDLADHQRGWIELDWDTAGGQKKGDLIPAWICCVCGDPEPNAYWLAINHSCHLIPGCDGHDRELKRRGPWRSRLAPVERWPVVTVDTGGLL